MNANLANIFYLVSGVLFILALRDLSSPASSRKAARQGMAGMFIAILTTLAYARPVGVSAWLLVALGMVAGGGFGVILARRADMADVTQLLTLFHSLIGLAAVLVAAGALFAPQAFGIGASDVIGGASLVEMSIALAIGAISLAGSVIAFVRLDGRMSSAPIQLPRRRLINIALAGALTVLIVIFVQTQSHAAFFLIALAALAIGAALTIPTGHADAPVVIAALNSCSGWAAAGVGFMLGNLALIVTGALVGSSCAMMSCEMRKAGPSATPQ